MKLRKRVVTLLVVTIAMFSLAASGVSEDSSKSSDGGEKRPKITFYVNNTQSGKDINDYAMPLIEEKYNCDIEIISRTDGTGVELKTMAAAGNLSDLFFVAGPAVCDALINSNNIYALDDAIVEHNLAQVIDLDKYVWSKKSSNGKTYVLSFEYPTTYQMQYNIEVFEKYNVKPPTNYEEFKQAVVTFKENNIIPFALFGAEDWPGVAFYDELVTRIDPNGIQGLIDGKSEITDEAFVRAAEQLQELAELGFVSKSVASTNASQAIEYFHTGKAAIFGNGAWSVKKLTADSGIGLLDNPLAEVGKEEATTNNHSGGALNLEGYGVNPNSENLDLAIKVLFDYAYYRAKFNVENYGAPNVLNEDIQPNTPRSPQNQEYAETVKNIETTSTLPLGLSHAGIQTAFYDNVNAVIIGAMDAKTFITTMEKEISKFR